ncbi:group II intron maturase-specific domain-containing protein, partial [Streptomyces sp. NPDC056821]|uniref:group II intron maturase-specific domain-containing protein n=1 Tax=unclassified Streptomyces TaxID=2593676 RepID=UPI003686E6B6
ESRMRENRMSGLKRRGLETEIYPPRQSPTLLDAWMVREYPGCPFERYADDAVVHCRTLAEAERVLAALRSRMAEVGLELHPDKIRIVYCKDDNRRSWFPVTEFTFLGFTFRRRGAKDRHGVMFTAFLPAISHQALKRLSRTVRSWRLHRRTAQESSDLARTVNPVVRGWMNYYGRFYRSVLYPLLDRINTYLLRWIQKKYRVGTKQPCGGWPVAIRGARSTSLTGPGRPRQGRGPERQEPYDGRLSRTVPWEPGGEIPPGDPTTNVHWRQVGRSRSSLYRSL